MKKMRLGVKIGLGFGSLIAISLLLGGLAAWSMKNVSNLAGKLASEYVPETALSHDIENKLQETMFEMRGYSHTLNRKSLDAGIKNFEQVKASLNEARELAVKSPDLAKFGEEVEKALAKAAEYERLVSEVVAKNEELAHNRNELEKAKQEFVQNIGFFEHDQNDVLKSEIEYGIETKKLIERQGKVAAIYEVDGLASAIRLAVWKAQAEHDLRPLQEIIQDNFGPIEERLDAVKAVTRRLVGLKQIDNIKSALNRYKTAMSELLTNWMAGDQLSTKRDAVGLELAAISKAAAKVGMAQTKDIAQTTVSRLSFASRVTTMGLIVAMALGVAIALFMINGITRPIKRVIDGLAEGTEQLNTASLQVSSAGQELAEGASEQAASIQQTSSSLEEMASMTRQNATNANRANELMSETRETISRANRSMDKLTASMGEISSASEEISKIIKTIDEIAFQTNLLALNAAVEAARAGEAGAGFAVVADEVRNLAMRAAEASKNTATLIEGTIGRVKEGSELVEETEEEFRKVAASVGKSGELVGEISSASQEQAQGIEQVNKAVSEMDKVVQQNAANAEESASASEEMNAQAFQMNGHVDELRRLVNGSKGNSVARNAAHSESKTSEKQKRIFAEDQHGRNGHSTNGNGKTMIQFNQGGTRSSRAIHFDDSDF